MILRFRVGNFRSFRDDAEISFVATRLGREHARPVRVDTEGRSAPALPVIAVFGANASGKSNLVRAFSFLRSAVRDSHTRWQPRQTIPRDHFKLDRQCIDDPTLLEIDFVAEEMRYQYGFELSDKEVISEWLYAYPHGRRQTWFERERSEYVFGKNLAGPNRTATEITRPNSLFLSAASTANHAQLTRVSSWFEDGLWITASREHDADKSLTTQLIREQHDERVSELLRRADLGILEAAVEQKDVPQEAKKLMGRLFDALFDPEDPERDEKLKEMSREVEAQMVEAVALVHSAEHSAVSIPFTEESLGTRAWYSLIGPILRALDNGSTLIVDEIDSSLHPLLMQHAIDMFEDPDVNRKGAQLVFTAHDTTPIGTLLGEAPLGRDQVWLAEKDDEGVTRLYSLSEFRPRKGENLQRGYLQGRYGGTPRTKRVALGHVIHQPFDPVE